MVRTCPPLTTEKLNEMANQEDANQGALLEQQRVLAEFGDFALKTEAIDTILNRACELVRRTLETDLAKLMELLPDGRTFRFRAGVGWRPGIAGEVTVTADENSPEGLTLKDGAVISANRDEEDRFEYHDFMKERGVEAFVNVLVLSSRGRPPMVSFRSTAAGRGTSRKRTLSSCAATAICSDPPSSACGWLTSFGPL